MDVVTKQAGTTSVVGETILHKKVQYTKKRQRRVLYGDDFETTYHCARYSWQ